MALYDRWVKTSSKAAAEADYHALPYHGLDVAACGSALLDSRPGLEERLAHLAGVTTTRVRDWFRKLGNTLFLRVVSPNRHWGWFL
jgi:hypothetical protein